MKSKFFTGILSALGLASALLLASAATVSQAEEQTEPSGTIELKQWKVGLIVGGGRGSGKLKFQGKTYPLKLKGLRIGATIEISRADIKGEVFHLTKVEDISGNYKAFQAGAAVIVGARKYWELKNEKGVLLRLKGREAGLELALDYGGLWLELEKD